MRRFLSAAVAMILLLPCLCTGAPAESEPAKLTVDGFNVTRGADTVIIYTGAGTTGTNQWGYEVCVDVGGRVIAAGGNDSAIPQGGFVISGHGKGAAALRGCARVGMHARYFEKTSLLFIGEGFIPPFYSMEYGFTAMNAPRAADTVIVYTGKGTTKTNAWGYEVRVDKNGKVLSTGGNDSAIPEGGFVLSGHGDGASLLRSVIFDGLIISYNSERLVFTTEYSAESMIYGIESRLGRLKAELDGLKDSFALEDGSAFDEYDALCAEVEAQVSRFRGGDIDALAAAEYFEKASASADSISAKYCESVPFEYRGVWLRPTETTRAAVHETVAALADMGVNLVCVETQYDCGTIFPVPADSLIGHHPAFGGFDALRAYIEECHAFGIELHCWMPVYYVGSATSANAKNGVYAKRPDLFLKNQNNSHLDDEGGSFLMLDPANEEATRFLLRLYEYLLLNYDIDCLQLDYIRYPGSGALDWGYFGPAADAFRAKYGFAPTYNKNAAWWYDWCMMRCGYVTGFVRRVRALIDEKAPGVLLSADVFSSLSTGRTTIYQDTGTWVREGLLDLLHPMTYGPTAVQANLRDFVGLCRGKCALAMGVGAFMGEVDPDVIYDQIAVLRGEGLFGSVTFESRAFFSKACAEKIAEGLYRDRAPSPLRDPEGAAEAGGKFFETRITRAFEAGEYSGAEKTALLDSLAAAEKAISAGNGVKEAEAFKALVLSSGGEKAARTFAASADMFVTCAKLASRAKPESGGYIYIGEKTTAEGLGEYITNAEGGISVAPASEYVGTGCVITVRGAAPAGKPTVYTVIVPGDVNGDGEINAADYAMVKRTFLGSYTLSGDFLTAAKVSGGGTLSALDYAMIKRHALGTYTITRVESD